MLNVLSMLPPLPLTKLVRIILTIPILQIKGSENSKDYLPYIIRPLSRKARILTQNSTRPHSAFQYCWVLVRKVLSKFYVQILKILEHSLIHVEQMSKLKLWRQLDLL